MSRCGRCGWEGAVARLRYRIGGEWKRTKPLCLLCRGSARRLIWRRAATKIELEACPLTPVA